MVEQPYLFAVLMKEGKTAGRPTSYCSGSEARRANTHRATRPARRMRVGSKPAASLCDTKAMSLADDPKSVKVNKTAGTGMEIEWKDGHHSSYPFIFLRDACPCALCNEARIKDGRHPGDPLKPVAGQLPMFKALARPTEVTPIGRYAMRFVWNDGHEHGIYTWTY